MIANRFLLKSSNVITDYSTEISKYKTGTSTLTAVTTTDALYLGMDFPFNHFYLKMGTTVNLVSTTMTVQLWNNNEFVDVVELNDETDALSQSGYVTFVPDKYEQWNREDTKQQTTVFIDELSDVTIYNKYWAKVTFADTLTSSVELSWLGQKFCSEDDLEAEHPQLNRSVIREAFESGKTDWEHQIIRASEVVVKDLISNGIIDSKERILEKEQLKLSTVSKLSEIIFSELGDDYEDDRIKARNEYKSRLNKAVNRTDNNNNAIIETRELTARSGVLFR